MTDGSHLAVGKKCEDGAIAIAGECVTTTKAVIASTRSVMNHRTYKGDEKIDCEDLIDTLGGSFDTDFGTQPLSSGGGTESTVLGGEGGGSGGRSSSWPKRAS